MLEVEGGTPEWCQMLLRHECGHAVDHAYKFSARPAWQADPASGGTCRTVARRTRTRRHVPGRTPQPHTDVSCDSTRPGPASSHPRRRRIPIVGKPRPVGPARWAGPPGRSRRTRPRLTRPGAWVPGPASPDCCP
jgi:hypothetical protein